MKLLRISIHGFKSFANKETIDIKDGITGIVGPNGSGKSNIVDAIRWVLGEQSIKDLRGGTKMPDVIFNGSKSKKPLSRAWVSLTFDNSDHYLKTDLTELEIKRVVYRTGENEYYINGEIVRLKDITNLFIDSGSSVNSLSIISQGKIGEIIDSKPYEKRFILEEVAGVLKYKKRKEETLRKLEKTNDNLSKINLIIDELSISLDPLKEQSEVAREYLKYKKDLEATEIALIAHDIKNINSNYKEIKEKAETLNNKLLTMDNTSIIDETKLDKLKLKLLKLEEEISLKQESLYKLTTNLSGISSNKQVMLERKKYEVEDIKLESNLINLKELELELKNNIKLLTENISKIEKEITEKEIINSDLLKDLKNLNIKRGTEVDFLSNLNKEYAILNNKIDILNENIDNDSKLPYAVKSILNNQRLNGIHNCLGKVIETEEKYSIAIDISLGYLSNVIIVDNEENAKEGINYLKSKSLGRATFFPINAIKPRGVDATTLSKIKDDPSFIGRASDLVKYNNIYKNIILNQLGNVIVVDNLNNGTRLGKKINNMYKIVTLDGQVISPGGSITGGSVKSSSGISSQKYELERLILLKKEKTNTIKLKEEAINETDYNIKILETKVFESTNNLNNLKGNILRFRNDKLSFETELKNILNEQTGTEGLLNNDIDKEVEKLLKEYYEVKGNKENLEINLNNLKTNKNDLQSEINEIELNNKKTNSNYNKTLNELKEAEVSLGKLDTNLDNLLLRLNEEYGLTYEKAIRDYILKEKESEARTKVNSLKRKIRALGDVNTGSISEYERINTRYTFLTNQKEDLTESINDILYVINELDHTMKERLEITYNELSTEFSKVFKDLFKGGEGELILTDKEDILTSGLEIYAQPPGKELKSTRLLSGGESTLTAIALLFSILNIRTVPFCILDEVEASLDEANVDIFGNYLTKLNKETQFIIITHKKRTMEYINNLYGITMQESGVSKIVSVKLD